MRDRTENFIESAKAYAEKRNWKITTLSRQLFNGNPYGFDRLEESLRTGTGGPPHINVIEAVEKLAELRSSKKKPNANRVAA